MTSITTVPHVVEECYEIRLFSDGSIVRTPFPLFPDSTLDDGSIEWKELHFGPNDLGLQLRLYRPKCPAQLQSPKKFPVFFYFHGGGFCVGSRAWSIFHDCCLRLAGALNAVVVAPDYRLAPEHRLPAALDDAASALDWLKSQAESLNPDPWLADSADFTRVFISGDSAGGNIAHHLAIRFDSWTEPNPVRIRGYVLLMPFFGGTQRTKSEAECPKDAFFRLDLADQFWRLSLPRGATADDPMANPLGPGGPDLDLGSVRFGSVMVVVGGKDLLRDRGVEYARRLEGLGRKVELVELQGKEHGFFAMNSWSDEAAELVRSIARFVDENGGGSS